MKEIRFHGRGGQGARMASEILATACVLEGGYVSAFPMFGAERRGAPVTAFLRFDEQPVRRTTQIYQPDCLMILDPSQLGPAAFDGIKPKGTLILNTSGSITEKPHAHVEIVGFVDAVAIALEEIGRPIVNTPMLGAFARTTGWVALDSILSSLAEFFSGDLLERNRNSVRKGYERTEIVRFS
ncbi:MAG: 2-oxoacid:acceptor oxidoreductase family protein [Candidatus Bipolaricaulia bacterium]